MRNELADILIFRTFVRSKEENTNLQINHEIKSFQEQFLKIDNHTHTVHKYRQQYQISSRQYLKW